MAYSLSDYGWASGQHSNTSGGGTTNLSDGFGPAIEIQFPDDFLMGTFSGLSSSSGTSVNRYENFTITANFTGYGNKFDDKIMTQSRNFNWSTSNSNLLVNSTSENEIEYFASSNGTCTVYCEFKDNFNTTSGIIKQITITIGRAVEI